MERKSEKEGKGNIMKRISATLTSLPQKGIITGTMMKISFMIVMMMRKILSYRDYVLLQA